MVVLLLQNRIGEIGVIVFLVSLETQIRSYLKRRRSSDQQKNLMIEKLLLLTFATHRPSDRTQLSLLRRDAKRSEGVTPKAKQAGVSGE